MKTMVMTATDGAEVLQLQDVPPPTLQGPHNVLIRLKAAGVNPLDTKLRISPRQSPHILGGDSTGVVETVGRAWRISPGDAVWYGTEISAAPAAIMPNMPW